MAITLKAIKHEQNRLAKMIAVLEAQSAVDFCIPQADIVLHQGEHYAGLILDEEGNPSHHLILLAGETEDISWPNAQDWAAEQGGELPTRREQALLYANLPSQFQKTWYWSCEQHKEDSSHAWSQYFLHGYQGNNNTTSAELRARAVRRLIID